MLQMAFCNVFAKPYFFIIAPPPYPLPLSAVLFGTLASVFQNVAPLQNCSETSAPPLCPLSPPVVIPECLLALLPMAGVETNEKRCARRARACIQACVCIYMCVYISLPPCYDTVTADPGHSAIMADEAGLPWQRLGRLVARWRDITAGLCNNLS